MRGRIGWLAAAASMIAVLTFPGRGLTEMDQDGKTDAEKPTFQIRAEILAGNTVQPAGPCQVWQRQALDSSQTAGVRREAIANLAKECRDHNVMQMLRMLINQVDQDAAVRSAAVRTLPAWEGSPISAATLVQALSVPGVREAAIETLEKMGPATGERERQLERQLTQLRGGSPRQGSVTGLMLMFGREPRLLEYLKELLGTGDRWDRAAAVSALCDLGEVARALGAAQDPDPGVRKSVAAALGRNREQQGAAALRQMAGDADAGVAEQARQSLELLGDRSAAVYPVSGRPAGPSWKALLQDLSEFRLRDSALAAQVPADKALAKWLGETGATETQLVALERRIGRRLPPSYRAFLAESNGFLHPTRFVRRMLGAAEVEWFGARHQDMTKIWEPMYPELASYLQVSELYDSSVLLLDPTKISADGEWEVHFLGSWIPGVQSSRNFREFIEAELRPQ